MYSAGLRKRQELTAPEEMQAREAVWRSTDDLRELNNLGRWREETVVLEEKALLSIRLSNKAAGADGGNYVVVNGPAEGAKIAPDVPAVDGHKVHVKIREAGVYASGTRLLTIADKDGNVVFYSLVEVATRWGLSSIQEQAYAGCLRHVALAGLGVRHLAGLYDAGPYQIRSGFDRRYFGQDVQQKRGVQFGHAPGDCTGGMCAGSKLQLCWSYSCAQCFGQYGCCERHSRNPCAT